MTVIVHCADVHLTAEQDADYALDVFREIAELTLRERAQMLLLAGDTFDSFPAMLATKSRFREILEILPPETRVLALEGNHEVLRTGGESVTAHDFGRAQMLSCKPFTHLEMPEYELDLIAIPHAGWFGEHTPVRWKIPSRRQRWRIALAHATVPAVMGRTLPNENDGGTLDESIFERLQADYAALGHIHATSFAKIGNCQCAYSGSARVWRAGEAGPRGVFIVRFRNEVSADFHPLMSAGQWRPITIAVDGDDRPQWEESLASPLSPRDWLDIRLTGIASHEPRMLEESRQLKARLAARFRRVDVDTSDVIVATKAARHPLAAKFLAAWQAAKPSPEAGPQAADVWLRARQVGLEALCSATKERG